MINIPADKIAIVKGLGAKLMPYGQAAQVLWGVKGTQAQINSGDKELAEVALSLGMNTRELAGYSTAAKALDQELGVQHYTDGAISTLDATASTIAAAGGTAVAGPVGGMLANFGSDSITREPITNAVDGVAGVNPKFRASIESTHAAMNKSGHLDAEDIAGIMAAQMTDLQIESLQPIMQKLQAVKSPDERELLLQELTGELNRMDVVQQKAQALLENQPDYDPQDLSVHQILNVLNEGKVSPAILLVDNDKLIPEQMYIPDYSHIKPHSASSVQHASAQADPLQQMEYDQQWGGNAGITDNLIPSGGLPVPSARAGSQRE